MPQNFIDCDREQAFLLPPSLRDWLAQDHLAWFVIDAVERMDLAAFYAAYRPDGHGRAAYDPAMMGWAQPVVATRLACDFKEGSDVWVHLGGCGCRRGGSPVGRAGTGVPGTDVEIGGGSSVPGP
jgi:hypothetical protein